MSDINFDCPQCGQNLEAPDTMAGLFIECPACSKVIKVPREHEVVEKRETTTFTPPPPRPAEDGDTGEEKGSTMRISLPPNLGVPQPKQRRIFIRRQSP